MNKRDRLAFVREVIANTQWQRPEAVDATMDRIVNEWTDEINELDDAKDFNNIYMRGEKGKDWVR